MITEKLIVDAWAHCRTTNNSIPDEVLDFMKDVSLAALQQQNSGNTLVSGWLEFEKHKPSSDKLILVTNGGYVEICFYENQEFGKPWAFDEDDRPVFKAKVKGLPRWEKLYWRYIELPAIH